MSSGLLKRTERHRLVGFLLRVRAVLYFALSIPLALMAAPDIAAEAVAVALAILAALAPFVVRRGNRYAGVRMSASIDIVASFILWFAVPWAGGMSLLLTLWAIAMVVFLSPARSASRIARIAITLEIVKIAGVLAGAGAPGSTLASEVTDVGVLFARVVTLSGGYLLFRAVDAYVLKLAAAAETGGERYRKLMDTAPTGYVIQDDSQIVYANVAAGDLLERPVSTLPGRSIVDLIVPEDRAKLDRSMQIAWDRLEPVHVENLRVELESSGERWVDVTCTVIDHGRDLAVQIALHDRSGQRRAEIDLHRTEVDYREFFERIPIPLYRSHPDGTIAQANAALLDLFGANSEDEITSHNAGDFYLDSADREHLNQMLEKSNVVIGYDAAMKRLDGQIIWVRDTSQRIETAQGTAFEGAMIDITSRRAIEDELWSRAAQQEAAATIGQIALDSDDIPAVLGEITQLVSQVLATEGVVLLRRNLDGGFGMTGTSGDFDLTADIVSSIADRAHMTTTPVVLRSEAEIRFASPRLAEMGAQSCAAVMIPGGDAAFGTLVAVAREERLFTGDDINFLLSVANVLAAAIDRAAAQERLEDLLRSKDAFVASVSHELRTPLTVVTGMAHELNEQWMNLSDKELGEFTSMLVEQSRDMSDLIDDLLVAARSNIGNVAVRSEHVSLEHEIGSVLAGFPDTGSSSITVHTGSGKAIADPIRVRQILRNLITNALRYGGPNIEIVTSRAPGTIAVEVSDDGTGIAAEDHDRIFVAYERAHHDEGQPGSVGLGLTVSRTLAELMGGSLTYRMDGQSSFRLELPCAVDDSADAPSVHPTAGDHALRSLSAVGSKRIGVDLG